MMDEFRVISENLRYLREKRGYTQEKLAEMVGLSASHISKVESGQRRVGMKTYLHILNVLNVSPDEYVLCAMNEISENDAERLREILEDCTEEEREFLLASLKNLKENMRKFKPV
ncbi:MAG: helix-turn-helix domain-containing protein [Eubacteriales bacterium]|nr:helix-turn-helix domain-containing protein [Eubacteriales bacterium]